MGFGHRVYKNYDPRARIIKQCCDDLLSRLGIAPHTELIFAPLRHRQGSAGLAEVFLDCLVLDEERRGAVTDAALEEAQERTMVLHEHVGNSGALVS